MFVENGKYKQGTGRGTRAHNGFLILSSSRGGEVWLLVCLFFYQIRNFSLKKSVLLPLNFFLFEENK